MVLKTARLTVILRQNNCYELRNSSFELQYDLSLWFFSFYISWLNWKWPLYIYVYLKILVMYFRLYRCWMFNWRNASHGLSSPVCAPSFWYIYQWRILNISTLYIPGFLLFCSVSNISIYSNVLQTIPITTCVNPMIISCIIALGATKIC